MTPAEAAAHRDDDLTDLERNGIPPLPPDGTEIVVDNRGARIWAVAWGDGPAVLLLHGGLGNAGNWAFQVPALIDAGYRVVAIDSRGQGRSTRDAQPYSYRLLASDTRAVMDALGIERAAIVGWSDGADTGLVLADETPERVAGVFFFACNMDNTGTRPFEFTPIIGRIYNQHVRDYAALSPTPEAFEAMSSDLGQMQRTQPDYTAAQLAGIAVPVEVVLGEHDEFIEPSHAEYLARTIPGATFRLLAEVSHFAPLQRPALFNAAILAFVERVLGHP